MKNDLVNENLRSTKAALDAVSESFCAAKWLQSTLHLHNGNTQSCHHVRSHKVSEKQIAVQPQALHNTSRKMKSRDKMLKGERPKECSYCWTAEDRGRLSDRVLKSSTPWARPHLEEVVDSKLGAKIPPRYLEVSFDSTCNFRCMYCSPAFSSSWMKEIQQFGPYPTSRLYNNLPQMHLTGVAPLSDEKRAKYIDAFWAWWPELSEKVEEFRITGGEPLLASQTFEVIERLIDSPRPALGFSINSNMGVGEQKVARLISLLNALKGKVRDFTLHTSIDCVGERAEYIRFGLDFRRYVANVEKILSQTAWPITVSYMITVNVLSVTGLKDLLAFICDQRRRYPQHRISLDTPFLQNPEHLSVGILSEDFVAYLDEAMAYMRSNMHTQELSGFYDAELVKVDRIRDLILTPRSSKMKRAILRRDFHKMMDEYDRRRRTDFAKTFPEYRAFKELCRKWALI